MIYLDYQATTPLAPEAKAAMEPWLDKFANPHSPHKLGREAAAAVELAREQIALALGASDGRLIFTSGATEAANTALLSAAGESCRRKLVAIETEHACVRDTALWLGSSGYETVLLTVGSDGLVDLNAARAVIDGNTAVVAAMLVNNEIGVIQPIEALSELAREAGALFFCDAVQGVGRARLPLDACDMVALSAHKIHGPKGVGALWLRDDVEVQPLLWGGLQEAGMRSGTLSPMLCAGFGAAAALMAERNEADSDHVARLSGLARERFAEWTVNGSTVRRYPGNLNLRRDGLDAGRLISEVREVAFSAGSACASGSGRPSHVLAALGLSDREARSSIRLGFGRYTTEQELARACDLIIAAADRQDTLAA